MNTSILDKKTDSKKWNTWLVRCFLWILSSFFILAGYLKLIDLSLFHKTLMALQLLSFIPPNLLKLAAITLGLIEIFLGFGLLVVKLRKIALLGVIGLLTFFICFIGYMIVTGETSVCGCLGRWGQTFGPKLVAQDLLLLFFAFKLFVTFEKKGNSLQVHS